MRNNSFLSNNNPNVFGFEISNLTYPPMLSISMLLTIFWKISKIVDRVFFSLLYSRVYRSGFRLPHITPMTFARESFDQITRDNLSAQSLRLLPSPHTQTIFDATDCSQRRVIWSKRPPPPSSARITSTHTHTRARTRLYGSRKSGLESRRRPVIIIAHRVCATRRVRIYVRV